jgi:hypothetical protein
MLSIWIKFFLTIIFIILAVWLGSRTGSYYRTKFQEEAGLEAIGSVVGAALGLLAFMLAFTFQLTANRYENRRELFRNEIVAIKSVYMQAELLKDTNRRPIRVFIKDYVDQHMKIKRGASKEELNNLISHLKRLQDSIWVHVILLSKEDRSSEIYSLITASITEMIEMFDKRVVVGAYVSIPGIIFWILYLIAGLSMFILGFQFGISGRSNLQIILTLALTFSSVMWLIFALDDPKLGIVTVNQQQLIDLREDISKDIP